MTTPATRQPQPCIRRLPDGRVVAYCSTDEQARNLAVAMNVGGYRCAASTAMSKPRRGKS